MNIINKARLPIFNYADLEPGAEEQAINGANHPKAIGHLAVMPDGHEGYGIPIGGVMALKDAVCPNAVGVDIGCEVGLVTTDYTLPIDEAVRTEIRDTILARVPVSFNVHDTRQVSRVVNSYVKDAEAGLVVALGDDVIDRAYKSIGTLGGGNHFIEIVIDDNNRVCAMVHTGSRKFGHEIATLYNRVAKEENPYGELSWLDRGTPSFEGYIRAMWYAVYYARANIEAISSSVTNILHEILGEFEVVDALTILHNYAEDIGNGIVLHRKGAIDASSGTLGIIPGSMGSHSYVVCGLGDEMSWNSASHGAGRDMSRNKATENLTQELVDEAMKGIVHREFGKVKRGRLKGQTDFGEAPQAYKNIDVVMNNQKDLVSIVTKLTPIVNVKG